MAAAMLATVLVGTVGPDDATLADGRPNFVVIMTDDQTPESLPVMQHLMGMPGGSWVKFTRAYNNASICCPARANFLSGQYSERNGVHDNGMGTRLDATNTLPVWLDAQGYTTALYGKYLNNITTKQPGWDVFVAQAGLTDKRTEYGVNFVKSATTPYFLWVSYGAPHNPAKTKTPARHQSAPVVMPPDPGNLNEADVSDKPKWVRNLTPVDLAAQQTERMWSQRALLAVDEGVKALYDAVAASGQLGNTVFIFLADNGYSFGSHRHVGKFCPYEECSHIPLVIRYPWRGGNKDEPRLASMVDIAPTIVDIANVTPGRVQDGTSLVPLLDDSAVTWRTDLRMERISGEIRRFYGIRHYNPASGDDWMYAEYFNGDVEMYDLVADRPQLNNLAKTPGYEARRADLAARLAALR